MNRLLVFWFLLAGSTLAQDQDLRLKEFMPGPEDHTSMWWHSGFPEVVEGAPWRRIVKTGHYWFMLDTETLRIPRLGSSKLDLGELSGADLELSITVDGTRYALSGTEGWSRFRGPRLIESGRFLQRADVTGLKFAAEDGTPLNVEARLESIAWPDRLGLVLAARPGIQEVQKGEISFGKESGGYGLDGSNYLRIPAEESEIGEEFTLEFMVYPPTDYQASRNAPWLLCRHRNEVTDGNFGIVLHSGCLPSLRMNIGGGRENTIRANADQRHALKLEAWNHLALSYDGKHLRLHVNGKRAHEELVGKTYPIIPGDLSFGEREDGLEGYRFRGILDEIGLHERALTEEEIQGLISGKDIDTKKTWSFRDDVAAASTRPRETWDDASLELSLAQGEGELSASAHVPPSGKEWGQAELMLDPVSMESLPASKVVKVSAKELATEQDLPVSYEPGIGWHRINLDGIAPIAPSDQENPTNDSMERVRLTLANSGQQEEIMRLIFEKASRGIQQRIGTPITGVSAVLRDMEGKPTGIPVQLSKNWHRHPEAGVYSGQWFHGISLLCLPPKSELELELCLVYGHWGGLPAATHSQLSLIGWGGNQRWDQSALGAWGESICHDPEQAQANCTITDVRPLMVTAMSERSDQWTWTNNVGGGDLLRIFNTEGKRLVHGGVRATYHKQGPCLTEVTYDGTVSSTGVRFSNTTSIARTDDVVTSTYRLKMRVTEITDFSRFVIFQTGADTYVSARTGKMAVGDEGGLVRQWKAQPGGNIYRGEALEMKGTIPWASLHETSPAKPTIGALANRGIIIREWNARLGGKEANPWFAEHGVDMRGSRKESTMDLIPPPDLRRLEPGDFVEATIELVVIPQSVADYYGPNESLRAALEEQADTWHMVHRQAHGDDVEITMQQGDLLQRFPDIRVKADQDRASFALRGGVGYVPVTISGLTSHEGPQLLLDGVIFDQSVHGNDFWQTDYDPGSKTWSRTWNLPAPANGDKVVELRPTE